MVSGVHGQPGPSARGLVAGESTAEHAPAQTRDPAMAGNIAPVGVPWRGDAVITLSAQVRDKKRNRRLKGEKGGMKEK